MNAYDHLEAVLTERTPFHTSEYFSEGYKLWKQHAKTFIIFTLILVLVQSILTSLPLGDLANEIWFRHAAALGGVLVSHRIFLGKAYDTQDFLQGFKFSAQIILAHLLLVGIIIVLLLPILLAIGIGSLTQFADFPLSVPVELLAGLGIWMGLLVIPIFYVLVLFAYVDCFIAFYNLPALDAIKYSVKFVHRQWFSVFGFFILIGLMVVAGLIGFIIGIVVTISMVYPIVYYSFQDMTQLEEFESLDVELMETH